jgi:hypothetical protein
MKKLFVLILLSVLAVGPGASASDESLAQKIGNGIEKGADATGRLLKRGGQAASKGLEKGSKDSEKGVKEGGSWLGKEFNKVGDKLKEIFK